MSIGPDGRKHTQSCLDYAFQHHAATGGDAACTCEGEKVIEVLEGENKIEVGDQVYVHTGREWAAKVIKQVGDFCVDGSYPQSVSAFDLGRALGRALVNCNEEDATTELIRGIGHWESNREEFRKALGIDTEESVSKKQKEEGGSRTS